MNKDRKLVFGVLALLVGIIVISISYAAFTQNLNINGTAVERIAPTIKSGQTSISDMSS